MTPDLQPTEYEERVKEGQHYLVGIMITRSFYVGDPTTSTLTDEFQLQNHNLSQTLNRK